MASEKENLRQNSPVENARCRVCRVIDGYKQDEDKCRLCGARLFKGDVL